MFRTMMSVTAVLLAGVSMAEAKHADASTFVVRDARRTLEDIEANVQLAEREADTIGTPGTAVRMDWRVQAQALTRMKDDMNRINGQVKALEAEQESLAVWEREALVQIVPALRDAANNIESAIRSLNANQISPWHSDVGKFAMKAGQDEDHVLKTLHAYLRLDHAKRAEEKSREELRQASGM